MRSLLLAAALLLATPAALAQTQGGEGSSSSPAATPAEAAATPPAAPAATAQLPGVPLGEITSRVRAEFLSKHLAYDIHEGQVVMGTDQHPVDRDTFYEMVGHPELVQKSKAALKRRLYLAIAGGTVAVAGVTVGLIEMNAGPKLDSAECTHDVASYSACVPESEKYQRIGIAAIVGGVAIGALLGTLAYWSSPEVLSPDEEQSLIARHNAELMRQLRGAKSSLRVTPVIGAGGGGLVASLHF